MIVVFLYQFSAGLTLYWTVQNLLTIAQMKLTKNIDEPGKGGTPAGTPAAGPGQPTKPATAPIPRSGKKKKKKK
jgi:membrane protein insertase Oxa1/YidC/SpoIIIJ